MWMLSAACLTIVVVSCLGALWRYKQYNIAQTVGLTLVFFGSFPRLLGIVETQSMMATPAVAEASILIHMGLAVMAVGHGWKLWQYKGHKPAPPRRLLDALRHDRGKPS